MRSAPARESRGLLHPVLRVALYLPAIVLVAALLALSLLLLQPLLLPLTALLNELTLEGVATGPMEVLAQGLFVVGAVLVTWLFRRWLDRRSLVSLGLQRVPGWLAELGLGFGLGALLMLVIFAISLLVDAYAFQGFAWERQSVEDLLTWLVVSFLGFAVVAFYEELMFRGYVLQNLALSWGRWGAVFGSSVLFAAVHLANPNAGVLPAVGLLFAGLLLAAGYLVTGRLWLPIGLHLSWNFVQGPVLGFPVSGLGAGGLVLLEPVGPTVLTGAGFGPEASIIGVSVELLGLAALWLWAHFRRAGASLSAERF